MDPGIEYLVRSATARKGNHPVLWLIFGAVLVVASAAHVGGGSSFVPDGISGFFLWEVTHVTWSKQPVLFVGAVLSYFCVGSLMLSVGIIALILPRRKRRPDGFTSWRKPSCAATRR